MPVICSRSTRLMLSMRSCIRRKAGTIRPTIDAEDDGRDGHGDHEDDRQPDVLAQRHDDADDDRDRARAIAIVQAITTSICTCCTSLVMRVISDGAPNAPDLAGREVGDLVEEAAAQVAAEAHRHPGAEVHGGDGEDALDERERRA